MPRLPSHVWAAAPSGQLRTWCGQAGLKEGCEVAAPFIRSGEKNPILWDCWQSVGALSRSSVPGSTCTALFCIHLLSSALGQAAAFPGLPAAQPALPWQGEDRGRTAAAWGGGRQGDVPLARQSRGNGCAVAGLERWRRGCVQLEGTARDIPGGPAGGRLVAAEGWWPLACRSCGHGARSRTGVCFAACCFP